MVNWKEVSKFLAGGMAFHTVGHIGMAFLEIFPLAWFGFTLTSTLNNVTIVVSTILTIIFVYYGWYKKN